MTYEVNQEAVEAYKRQRNSQTFMAESDYLPGSGMESPPVSPTKRMPKDKPTADRSLRIDSWVGGYGPDGKKPRRSWKIKGEIRR